MRVLIDITFARRAPRSGTGIYIARLCQELHRLGDVDLVEVANPRRRAPAGGGAGSLANALVDHAWSAVTLPRLARRHHAEVLHHPLPALAPVAPWLAQVVTVTDLAYERMPAAFARAYRVHSHLLHRAAARAADRVICISRATADDVADRWGVRAERITVAHLGPGQTLPTMSRAQTSEHLLYVGDAEPRKNLGVLLHAYAQYRARAASPLPLVLAGSARADAPGVRSEPAPSPERLGELYRTALALVHPSLLEGFGLTPLEAMALGTPVIAARSPGITEVCGDAVRYCDPHDPEAFAAAMAELQARPELRAQLRARGIDRARAFSWVGCARAHADAYSLALT